MKKFVILAVVFSIGLLAGAVTFRSLGALPYDFSIHRASQYELWISMNPSLLPGPMSPFDCVVRLRKICADTGNICSDWETVADFQFDSPSRADEWKLTETGDDLRIDFPEGIVVRRTGDRWTTIKEK